MIILPSNSSGEFEVANSLRFNDGSSDHLSRTPSSASNRRTWTWSSWIKLGAVSGDRCIFSASSDASNRNALNISNEAYFIFDYEVGGSRYLVSSQDAVYRDPSAWYHVVLAVDTTQSTNTNRVKIYVNGSQITLTTILNGYPPQNADMFINNNIGHAIGKQNWGTAYYDGYMTEVVLIDGSQLDPTSFGEFSEDENIWRPIDVSSLTFGTNGFYLYFENSGSLGADVSGNGNNFTVNNLTSIDQTTDTCTNNFATFSPLVPRTSTGSAIIPTFSNGNLSASFPSTPNRNAPSTIAVSSGKWYAEIKMTSTTDGDGTFYIGVNNLEDYDNGFLGNQMYAYVDDGRKKTLGTYASYGNSFTNNDIIGIAFDSDNGTVWFSKNGTWQNSATQSEIENGTTTNSAFSGLDTSKFWNITVNGYNNKSCSANYGNPPFSISSGNSDGSGYGNFEYAVPSGYYALNTKNLSEYG